MFNLNNFIMKTLKGMVGHYPDFQVREYAANWYAKGTLTVEDVEEIDNILEAQYIVPETPVVDEHEPMVIPEIIEDEVPAEEPETEGEEELPATEETTEPVEEEPAVESETEATEGEELPAEEPEVPAEAVEGEEEVVEETTEPEVTETEATEEPETTEE